MKFISNQPKLVPRKNKTYEIMKVFRCLILSGVTLASLCGPRTAWAQAGTTNPVVVPHDDKDLYRDLRGAPDNIKTLIVSFDQTRDKYLAEQRLLLIKLKKAATPEERERIRALLQANRQAFLEALKTFRAELKVDLAALRGKISHQEFLRIIDAAHDAATEGGIGHHRGH